MDDKKTTSSKTTSSSEPTMNDFMLESLYTFHPASDGASWLEWDPDDQTSGGTVKIANHIREDFLSFSAFGGLREMDEILTEIISLSETEYPESTPGWLCARCMNTANLDPKEKADQLNPILNGLTENKVLDPNEPVPKSKVYRIHALREEAERSLLQSAQELEQVFRHLRDTLTVCAIETCWVLDRLKKTDKKLGGYAGIRFKYIYELGKLWEDIKAGMEISQLPIENIKSRFTPTPIEESTLEGVLTYLQLQEDLLENVRAIWLQHWAAEKLITSAQSGNSVVELCEESLLPLLTEVNPMGFPLDETGRRYLRAMKDLIGKEHNGLMDWCEAIAQKAPKSDGVTPSRNAPYLWLLSKDLHETNRPVEDKRSYEITRRKAEDYVKKADEYGLLNY